MLFLKGQKSNIDVWAPCYASGRVIRYFSNHAKRVKVSPFFSDMFVWNERDGTGLHAYDILVGLLRSQPNYILFNNYMIKKRNLSYIVSEDEKLLRINHACK